MSMFGRVIMVGNLACYNQVQVIPLKTMPMRDVKKKLNQSNPFLQKAAPLPALDLAIVLKELTIAGFNVYRSDKIFPR